jgi:hypothetical protein
MAANRLQLLAFGAIVALCAAPLAASAQAPSYSVRGETITGTIASVENVNHIFVADDRGYTDDVTLRAGASILSNGVRLEPGQRVTITGSNGGKTFVATRIATTGRSSYSASTTVATYPVYYPAYYAQPVYYAYNPFFYSYYGSFYGYGPYYRGYGRGYGGFGYGYGRGYGGYGYGRGYGGYGYGRGYGGYGYGRGYGGVSVGVHIHIR